MAAKVEVYERGKLPASLVWQSLSFMRCEWPRLFTGDGRLRSMPYPATAHVTCTDGPVLLSYADIVKSEAIRAQRALSVIGLSNVFTFPPYRHEGHASEVVKVADSLIDAHQPGIAILFCERDLVSFYSARGWTSALTGSIVSPADGAIAMVRHTSMSGPNLIAELERSPLTLASAW